MKKIMTLTLILASAIPCFCADPAQDYLSRNTNPENGLPFEGEPWNGDNHEQPSGGYLLRFEAPIGRKSEKIVFVTTSLKAGLHTSTWSAYKTTAKAGSVLLSDEIDFVHLNLYLSPPTADRAAALCEIIMDRHAFGILAYYLDNDGAWKQGRLEGKARNQEKEEADPFYLDHEAEDLAAERHLTRFTPKMERILLAEYLRNPSAKWRPCKGHTLRGQGADPDEKSHLSEAKAFRKEDAARLWKARQPDKTP